MIFNQLNRPQTVTENYDFIPIDAMIQMESAQQSLMYLQENLSINDPSTSVILENAFSNTIKKIIEFFKKLFAKIKEFFKGKEKENDTSDAKVDDLSDKLKKIREKAEKEANEREELREKNEKLVEEIVASYKEQSKMFVLVNQADYMSALLDRSRDLFEKSFDRLLSDVERFINSLFNENMSNREINVKNYEKRTSENFWKASEIKRVSESKAPDDMRFVTDVADIIDSATQIREKLNKAFDLTTTEISKLSLYNASIEKTFNNFKPLEDTKYSKEAMAEAVKFRTVATNMVNSYTNFIGQLQSLIKKDKDHVLKMLENATIKYGKPLK